MPDREAYGEPLRPGPGVPPRTAGGDLEFWDGWGARGSTGVQCRGQGPGGGPATRPFPWASAQGLPGLPGLTLRPPPLQGSGGKGRMRGGGRGDESGKSRSATHSPASPERGRRYLRHLRNPLSQP